MKTQKYLITIEMPDGDMIGPGWIKDLLEADCDVEDVGRHKVSVIEIKEPDYLDEAVDTYAENTTKEEYYTNEGVIQTYGIVTEAFKAGAQWKEAQILRRAVKGYVGVHLHDKRADVTVNSGYLPESMGIKGDSEVYLVVLKIVGESK